jgi:2'-phosphotransferase
MSSHRGGRGGGGRSREPPSRSVQISKKLSWLLRHGAESENLNLGPGGYANLADVLTNRKLKGLQISFEEVRQVVEENEKQRFSLVPVATPGEGEEEGKGKQQSIPSTDPKDWKIRANQGHSLKIDDEGLLQPISADDVPETAVHGTSHSAWMQIVETGGLKTMGRNHVHFASGLPAGFSSLSSSSTGSGAEVEAPMISGMRSTSTILIYLDVKKAMEAGLKFSRSENGVILTEGDENGLVPLAFFRKVEDRTGEGVLVEDGKVVKEAPTHWAAGVGGRGKRGGRGRGKG